MSNSLCRKGLRYPGRFLVTALVLLRSYDAEAMQIFARDCAEIKAMRPGEFVPSGVYSISPIPGVPIRVFCDMDNQEGGWTVIQQRGYQISPGSDRQNFYLPWDDYEQGFGSPAGDHWLGLLHISALTRLQDSQLYIEMMDFDLNLGFAKYEQFRVGGSLEKYRLNILGFEGNQGDSLSGHNGKAFTTMDQDNDLDDGLNCAERFQGAWWYNSCHASNLNGLYAPDGSNGTMPYGVGINWSTWRYPEDHEYGYHHSLKQVRMKIRSRAYRG